MSERIKKLLSHLWHVPYWVFLLAFVVSSYVSVVALRHNNETMINLRNAVYAADKNNGNIEVALDSLRGYVYGHMNTNLSSGGNAIKPPIQLKYTYERLLATEKKRADATNAQVTIDAQNYCATQNPGYDAATKSRRFDCAKDYLSTHRVQSNSIPTALYEYDFISPAWSPDSAGWSLLTAAAFFMLFLVSFLLERMVRMRMRAQDI